MDETTRPAGAEGKVVVTTLPAEIDITNITSTSVQLRASLASGAEVVIADLTATTFCDCSGVRNLLLAHHQAVAGHVQLRVACSSPMVLRVIGLLGLSDQLAIYPSLGAAFMPTAASDES